MEFHFDQISSYTLGFLGCGKISSALCRGYTTTTTHDKPKRILVSKRSIDKSQALVTEFPDLVEICDDNADIVARADIIFIGLLPGVARETLPTLAFRDNQLLISMMAAVDYEETVKLLSNHSCSRRRIVRTVPLPSSQRQTGPILLFPRQEEVISILSIVGTPIICKNEDEMKPMISITGHISSFYELMRTSEEFLVNQGELIQVALNFHCLYPHP